MNSPLHHWSFCLRFIAVVTVLTVFNCLIFPWEDTLAWMREGGVVENFTILMYYVALAALWLFPPVVLSRLTIGAGSLLLLAAAAREMDLHKAMFGMSILKTNFYREYASGPQIAAALMVLLPILVAGGYLFFSYAKPLLRAAKAREAAAFTLVTSFVFLVLIKAFDSVIGFIGTMLETPGQIWGYTTPAGLITMALEETLEMIWPLMFVIAILQAKRQQSS